MSRYLEKVIAGCLYCMAIIVLIYMIMLCFNKSVWKDEVFVFNLIQHPYSYFLLTNRDAAPPLHFVIVKFAVDLGQIIAPSISSIIIGKLISVLPFIIMVVFSAIKLSKYIGWLSASLFSFLITTMPKMFGISIEVRMYSWALLFTTLCFFYFYVMINEESKINIIKCMILGVLATYTHYYVCFAIAFAYIIFSLFFIATKDFKNLKRVIFVIVGSSLLFLPWLIIASRQVIEVAKNFWIPRISGRDLLGIFTYGVEADVYEICKKYSIAFVFYIIFIIITIYIIKSKINVTSKITILIGFAMPFLVSLTGIFISYFLPVFQARYIFPSLGCLWLVFSFALSRFKDKHRVCFILIMLFILYVGYVNVNKNVREELVYKENMEKFQDFFDTLDDEDILITNNYRIEYCLPMYISNMIYCWNSDGMEDWEVLPRAYQKNKNVYYLDAPPENEREATVEDFPEKLQDMGYFIEDMGEFKLEYVRAEIYKISE